MSDRDVFPSYNASKNMAYALEHAWAVKDWTPWSIMHGEIKLDSGLDDQVKKLIDISMISKEALDKKSIFCPYWYARFSVCLAVAEAYHEYNRRKNSKEHIEVMRNFKADADKLSAMINDFFETYEVHRFYEPILRPSIGFSSSALRDSISTTNSCYDKLNAARVVFSENLEVLKSKAAANIEAISRTGTEGLVMHQTFAERIGMTWCDLTGKPPTSTQERFMRFLKYSYKFAGGSVERNWINIVDTVCDRMKATPSKYRQPGCGGWDHGDFEQQSLFSGKDEAAISHRSNFVRGGELRRMAEMYVGAVAGSDEKEAAYRYLTEEARVDVKTDFGKKWLGALLASADMERFWEENSTETA